MNVKDIIGPPSPNGYYILVLRKADLERLKTLKELEKLIVEPLNDETVILKSKSRSVISKIVKILNKNVSQK